MASSDSLSQNVVADLQMETAEEARPPPGVLGWRWGGRRERDLPQHIHTCQQDLSHRPARRAVLVGDGSIASHARSSRENPPSSAASPCLWFPHPPTVYCPDEVLWARGAGQAALGSTHQVGCASESPQRRPQQLWCWAHCPQPPGLKLLMLPDLGTWVVPVATAAHRGPAESRRCRKSWVSLWLVWGLCSLIDLIWGHGLSEETIPVSTITYSLYCTITPKPLLIHSID